MMSYTFRPQRRPIREGLITTYPGFGRNQFEPATPRT